MKLEEALDDLFATGSHIRVLRALDALPSGVGVSGRELARRARVSPPTAREALASLVTQGVVRVARSLQTASYRFNSEHVLVGVIHELFERERAIPRDLEREVTVALRKLDGVEAGYIFGSAARGDMLPASDIDVAVVSAKPLPEELPQLETIHRRYGNRVNVIRLRQRAGRGLRERVRIEGKSLPLSPSRRSGA
jgi:predicted nucleotidyltransferase